MGPLQPQVLHPEGTRRLPNLRRVWRGEFPVATAPRPNLLHRNMADKRDAIVCQRHGARKRLMEANYATPAAWSPQTPHGGSTLRQAQTLGLHYSPRYQAGTAKDTSQDIKPWASVTAPGTKPGRQRTPPKTSNPGPPLQPQVPSRDGKGRLPRTRTTRGRGRQHQAKERPPEGSSIGTLSKEHQGWDGFLKKLTRFMDKNNTPIERHSSCRGQTWWGEFQMIPMKLKQSIAQQPPIHQILPSKESHEMTEIRFPHQQKKFLFFTIESID